MVKSVKEKIEAKEGIPIVYQCLVFNGKPLMDDKSLIHYNIREDSNLRINLQVWQPSEYHEAAVEPSVDWTKLATTAKDKIDQEVEEKKACYAKFLKRKLEAVEEAKNVVASMKSGEVKIRVFAEQLLDEENEAVCHMKQILWLKQELQRMCLALELTVCKKRKLEKGIKDEQECMDYKRQKLSSLEDTIRKAHGEMQETLLLAGDELVKKNEDLARKNQKYELALKQSISAKEALLECTVCYQTASPPIYKCPMEHLICSGCMRRVKSKCSTWRAELFSEHVTVCRLAEQIWEELQKLKESVTVVQKEENDK
eukprot:GFUD01020661.1.p1 GENE.GFUD01020661.1~~GFUD01020661.1.p1  ORF type:complete len:344 (+),score=90.13 GFUD01020661.1:96-1034(+)